MAKYEATTRATDASVVAFIAAVPDPRRREEAKLVDALHRRVTGLAPQMWGPTMIGYGRYRYRYASGHAGEAMRGGFSPRKAALTVYLIGDFGARQAEAEALYARLGKHKLGKCCLYLNKLADVDLGALEALVALSWAATAERYPEAGA
jgi:hypothetical protein